MASPSPATLLAVVERTHLTANGEELTTRKPWGSRRTSVKKKRARPKRKSVRSAETRKTTPKKKTKANTAAKKSWAAARKRAKTKGISVREARSEIAAKQDRRRVNPELRLFDQVRNASRHASRALKTAQSLKLVAV